MHPSSPSGAPPPEPFRFKGVEAIRLPTPAERASALLRAGYNVFLLRSEEVYIDLLTDSGTGAMSDRGWSALMRGDESYAGARSFEELRSTIERLLGFPLVIPTHQGRGAENVLGAALLKEGSLVPGNAHFDTTKAHIENRGGRAVDLTSREGHVVASDHPFKGNVDVRALDEFLAREKARVPYVLVTVTCNTVGGQPVSLANLREVRRICDAHGVRLFLDIARYAENSWFIQRREKEYGDWSIPAIAREIMDLADCVAMSGKKDGLANIGGFLAMREQSLFDALVPYAVLYEGFLTYGGMAGRDLAAMAVGLEEALEEDYLTHRIEQVAFLGSRLRDAGVPVLTPFGGHAVYVDAARFLSHVPREELPAQSLVAALYREHGVRAVEVGTVMAGRDPDTGQNVHPDLELVRLAIPRRTYTNAHMDYVAEAVIDLWKRRATIGGLAFEKETPILRHFTSRFRPAGGARPRASPVET